MEATELWCLLEDTDDLFDGYIRVVYDEYNDSYYHPNSSPPSFKNPSIR